MSIFFETEAVSVSWLFTWGNTGCDFDEISFISCLTFNIGSYLIS